MAFLAGGLGVPVFLQSAAGSTILFSLYRVGYNESYRPIRFQQMKPPHAIPSEVLFAYDTLQQPEVQLVTFGRILNRHIDQLPGYRTSTLPLNDVGIGRVGDRSERPIVSHTGAPHDLVAGALLSLSTDELRQADSHAVIGCRRQRVLLSSGTSAWAYVDARDPAVLSSMLVCRFYASDEWL